VSPQVVLCEASPEGLRLMEEIGHPGGAAFVFVYHRGMEADGARAVREGARFCLPAPADADLLRAVVSRCAVDNVAHDSNRRDAQALAQDLRRACRLQQAMFPPPTRRAGGFDVALRWQPSDELRGDLADYATDCEGRLALMIADVAGHGVSAALLTTVVKSAFCASAAVDYDPRHVVAAVAAGTRPFGAERFVTLIAARLSRKRGGAVLEYVNAGHPPAWLLQRGNAFGSLEPTGPLVSPGFDEADWERRSIDVPANSGLLMYTDGVTDAEGDAGRFTVARLAEAVGRHRGAGSALLDGILASVQAFTTGHPRRDDITLLTASVGVPGLA
jgi:sigma-B regulation protein RsbU (phosphoserine phosphatase)